MEDTVVGRPQSEMTLGPLRRLGLLPRLLCRTLLSKVRIDSGAVEHVRNLATRGSVVYVMRYRSLVDTMLVVFILMRERLPLPEFIAGVSTLWLRPLREIVTALWHRLWSPSRGDTPQDSWQHCRRVVTEGKPVLIFMRGRATGVGLYRGNPDALQRVRRGREYLREIVISEWSRSGEVYVVPLAVLRGHGYRRKESRLATLLYTVQEAPGEMKRFLSLVWNAGDASITVGKHVDLREFVGRYRDEGAERIVRRLARALQIFLHREERVVLGPTLLPKRVVCDIVVGEPEVREAVAQTARDTNKPEERVRRTAESYFHEMAASFHGSYFAFLVFVFNRLWRRMFKGLETHGLEKVIDCVKLHPVVLVPCHRSHFDYLILSYIFHINHLSPPHIAAGINLSFWPLGPLFRGAGAYFIRRSFGDDVVYKAVFRSYMKFLIREGYTQEFFIEGGRSRSGKLLTPKLGMLSAIVNAFVDGARRDLYLVPVSIHYGRVVEEQSYSRELSGGEKEKESLSALLRARSVLRQTYGAVSVSFADPISLNELLGDGRERMRRDTPEVEEEKRRFTQKLGLRLLREINGVTVAGSTSVSATVLLSSSRAAWRYRAFLPLAQELVRLLRHRGVEFTPALERNQRNFLESLAFLEYSGLVRRLEGGQVIEVPIEKRVNLDFYKNNTIHFFLVPALLLQVLRSGARGAAIVDELRSWLDLYRWEFPLPEKDKLRAEIDDLLAFFRREHVLASDDTPQPDHPMVRALSRVVDNFHEAYWITAEAIERMEQGGMSEKAFRNAVRRGHEVAIMLGDVGKPEGSSTTTVSNALNRYGEIGLIEFQDTGKGRERRIVRGARFDDLAALRARLSAALRVPLPAEIVGEGMSPRETTTLN